MARAATLLPLLLLLLAARVPVMARLLLHLPRAALLPLRLRLLLRMACLPLLLLLWLLLRALLRRGEMTQLSR